MAKIIFITGMLIAIVVTMPVASISKEDSIAQVAIDTLQFQVRLPKGAEVKFLEKKESPVPDFYAVKLLIILPDKEIPVLVYVDKTGEKVFVGNLFIRGENVTTKEAGPPRPKISPPHRAAANAPLRFNAPASQASKPIRAPRTRPIRSSIKGSRGIFGTKVWISVGYLWINVG